MKLLVPAAGSAGHGDLGARSAHAERAAAAAGAGDKGLYRQLSAPEAIGKTEAKAAFAAFRKAFKDPKLVSTRAWGIDLDIVSETTLSGSYSPGGGAPARPITLHFLDIVSVTRGGEWILGADTYDNRAELLAPAPAKPPGK